MDMSDSSIAKRMAKARDNHNRSRLPLIITLVVLFMIAAVYLGIFVYFRSHFLPNTYIDTVNVSGMNASDSHNAISRMLGEYVILVTDREGGSFRINASDCGITEADSSYIEEAISSQNSLLWPKALFTKSQYKRDYSSSYDESMIENAVSSLSYFDEDIIIYPEDAYLSYSEEDGKYVIVPEVMGTELIKDNLIQKLESALSTLSLSVTLDDDDYINPERYESDDTMQEALIAANNRISLTITYDVEGLTEVVESDTIAKWISIDKDLNVSYDEDAIAEYVDYLAHIYNTYANKREFKTTLGDTITIGGGDYGWVVDKSGEKAQIIEDLQSGTSVEREPVYEQTAVTRNGDDDIGDTYIEIDYTNQHLYYYKDGALTLDSLIVSGNTTKGNGSPDGVFKIIYQEKDATLVGEDYESDVAYFMVFAYNVGIHDADWRSKFGGQLYKTQGSHGCVNVPYSFAEQLYAVLATGTPVVAYYREEVELTSENCKIANAYSYVDPDADEEENSDASDESTAD